MASGEKLVIGMTGGLGSGKSTVAAMFESLGATVIDTDVLAREVVAPQTPGLHAVVERFGAEILAADGSLNRARLRELVFSDDKARKDLEAILHPLIRIRMREQIAAATGAYCIVCIPLLLETGQADNFDRVLVIDAPREQQLARALARDGSPQATIESMLDAQIDRASRLQAADDVIDNSGAKASLAPQIEQLHQQYLQLVGALSAREDRRRQ